MKVMTAEEVRRRNRAASPFGGGWPPPARPPQEHWLKRAIRERELEAKLRGIKTVRIVAECPEAAALADDFPNVWVLSQASRAALLRVPGVGPARLRAVEKYLVGNRVALAWRAG